MYKFVFKYKSLTILIIIFFLSILLMFWSIKHTTPIEAIVMDGLLKISEIKLLLLRGGRDLWRTITTTHYLSYENAKLRAMVRELTKKEFLYENLLKENERLRLLLGYKKVSPYKTVASEVIGYDPTNWFHSVILNCGKKDGVCKDQAVIAYLGVKEGLVGKVTKVGESWSEVLLISDLNSRVGVEIQRTQFKGVLEGFNKRVCRLKYIHEDADVKVGDIVLTSGEGGIFPEGIPVGRVVDVKKRKGEMFLDIYVAPFIEFTRLEDVLIIVENKTD